MIVKSCYVAGGAVGFEENWDAKQKDLEAFYPKLVAKYSSHIIRIYIYIYIHGKFTCICHENQPNLGIPCMDGMGISNFAQN